ncbi:MAG: adenylate/guanylate cyclase domain-containing protein [Verrucomicrobiae bacterium]
MKSRLPIAFVILVSYVAFGLYMLDEAREIREEHVRWFLEIPHAMMLAFLLFILPISFINISKSIGKNEESRALWKRFSLVFALPYIVVVTYVAAEWSEIDEAWIPWLIKPSHFLIVLINGFVIPVILWVIVRKFIQIWIERECYLKRIEELEGELRSFVNPELYKRIYEKTSLEEKGAFKIVMADIQGFTTFCEGHRANAIADLASEFCDRMDREIQSIGGITLSYAGDLVFALFSDSTSTEAIVDTSRKMRKSFQVYARNHFPDWDTDLNIGMHYSDDIVLGTIGGGSAQKHFTANGFGICEVSRICAEAKDGQLLMSEDLLKTIEPSPAEIREKYWTNPPKNIGRPIRIFEIPQTDI